MVASWSNVNLSSLGWGLSTHSYSYRISQVGKSLVYAFQFNPGLLGIIWLTDN